MIELLAAFNALLPKDLGSRRAGGGLAYGANPRQMLDIYAPRAAGNGRPVIIFFYGGAWSSGNRQGYGFVGRALAAKGFVVAVPDYRLVPEVEYPGFLEDAAAAVRWVRAHAGE
jgi:acetyl esterase/lipase